MSKKKKTKERKKKGTFMKLFKLIFSLFFLIVTIIWTLFTISFIGLNSEGWEWAQNLPGVPELNKWLTEFIASHGNDTMKRWGLYAFMVGIDVVLVYTTIFYPIQKIPFLGKMLKWITGIIPTLGAIAIIAGVILLWVI